MIVLHSQGDTVTVRLLLTVLRPDLVKHLNHRRSPFPILADLSRKKKKKIQHGSNCTIEEEQPAGAGGL